MFPPDPIRDIDGLPILPSLGWSLRKALVLSWLPPKSSLSPPHYPHGALGRCISGRTALLLAGHRCTFHVGRVILGSLTLHIATSLHFLRYPAVSRCPVRIPGARFLDEPFGFNRSSFLDMREVGPFPGLVAPDLNAIRDRTHLSSQLAWGFLSTDRDILNCNLN
jgi:hypothetical protein